MPTKAPHQVQDGIPGAAGPLGKLIRSVIIHSASLCCLAFFCHAQASTPELQRPKPLRIVGSSTVFPFMALAAEHAAASDATFPAPIVEATGTGAGIRIVSTAPDDEPVLATASRPLTASERCAYLSSHNHDTNGGDGLEEVILGLDGLVIVTPASNLSFPISVATLHKALAAYIPSGSSTAISSKGTPTSPAFLPNPYKRWSDIDPTLPSSPILIYGPPGNAGLSEALQHLVFDPFCQGMPQSLRHKCHEVRRDGVYVEMPENSTLMLKKIEQDTTSVGLVSFRFYDQNRQVLQSLPVDGVLPTPNTIRKGTYPLTRKLFLYARRTDLAPVNPKDSPGKNLVRRAVHRFMSSLTSEALTKPGGAFEELGLIKQ